MDVYQMEELKANKLLEEQRRVLLQNLRKLNWGLFTELQFPFWFPLNDCLSWRLNSEILNRTNEALDEYSSRL
jgi:hypothetical protein